MMQKISKNPDGSSSSLLEDFGFIRQSRDPSQLKLFGESFSLLPNSKVSVFDNPFDSEDTIKISNSCLMIVCRAYLLISDRRFGSLIIRNSSLVFGRDSLSHPAFYSQNAVDNGFSYEDLIHLDKEVINQRFSPLLSRHLNGVRGPNISFLSQFLSQNGIRNFNEEILHLLSEINAVLNSYESFKFDTDPRTVFKKSGSQLQLSGAYNSIGFKNLVQKLDSWLKNAGNDFSKIPDLALVPAYAPPWEKYEFDLPVFGNTDKLKAIRFSLDEFSLDILKQLAKGECDHDMLYASGLQDFFQVAIDENANLLILDKE